VGLGKDALFAILNKKKGGGPPNDKDKVNIDGVHHGGSTCECSGCDWWSARRR